MTKTNLKKRQNTAFIITKYKFPCRIYCTHLSLNYLLNDMHFTTFTFYNTSHEKRP